MKNHETIQDDDEFIDDGSVESLDDLDPTTLDVIKSLPKGTFGQKGDDDSTGWTPAAETADGDDDELDASSETAANEADEADEADRARVDDSDENGEDGDADEPSEELPEIDVAKLPGLNKIRQKEAEIAQARADLEAKQAQVEQMTAIKAEYGRNRRKALRKFLESTLGTDDKARIDAELEGLYDEISSEILGVPVNSEAAAISETRSLRDEVRQLAQQNREAEEKRRVERQQTEHQRLVAGAIQQISSSLESELRERTPFLAAEDNAPEIVWSIINDAWDGGRGQELTIEQAARLANNHFKQEFEKKASKLPESLRGQYVTPAQSSEDAVQRKPKTSKRSKRTITNKAASEAPDIRPGEFIEDDEESKLAAIRRAFKG